MAPGIDEQELKEYEQQQQLREFSVMQRRMRAKRHVERLDGNFLSSAASLRHARQREGMTGDRFSQDSGLGFEQDDNFDSGLLDDAATSWDQIPLRDPSMEPNYSGNTTDVKGSKKSKKAKLKKMKRVESENGGKGVNESKVVKSSVGSIRAIAQSAMLKEGQSRYNAMLDRPFAAFSNKAYSTSNSKSSKSSETIAPCRSR